MKKAFKNYVKLGVFLLGISLTLVSCQKDDEISNQKNETLTLRPISVIKISKEEIQSNSKIVDKLTQISTTKTSRKTLSRTVLDEVTGIEIETDYAILYTDTTRDYDYHSYTFPVVNTPIGAGLENILISLQPDGTYKDYLIHYEISEEEIEMIYNKDFVDLEGKINFLLLENGTFSQNTFEKIYFDNDCWYESTEIAGEPCCGTLNHSYGEPCPHSDVPGCAATEGFTHTTLITCNIPDGGGGDPTGGDPTGGDPNLNDGGSDDSIIIVDCDSRDILCNEIEDCNPTLAEPLSYLVLTEDEICWLNHSDQTITKLRLENYLTDGGDSAFAQLAFEALDKDGIDDGKVDFVDEIILHPTFSNNAKVNCIYEKLKLASGSSVFKEITNNFFESSKNAHIQFSIGTIPGGEDAITQPFISDPTNLTGQSNYKIILDSSTMSGLSAIEIALTLIHETIHAELIERCYRLGLINSITYVSGQAQFSFNSNPTTFYNTHEAIYQELINQYFSSGITGTWNHDLFNVLNYRDNMVQNLLQIHGYLNDSITNDFLTNVNSDPSIIGGPYTLNDLMEYMSWIGLENTSEYISSISSIPSELAKKVYVQTVANTKYTHNGC